MLHYLVKMNYKSSSMHCQYFRVLFNFLSFDYFLFGHSLLLAHLQININLFLNQLEFLEYAFVLEDLIPYRLAYRIVIIYRNESFRLHFDLTLKICNRNKEFPLCHPIYCASTSLKYELLV